VVKKQIEFITLPYKNGHENSNVFVVLKVSDGTIFEWGE
jgi:hypothetical protein